MARCHVTGKRQRMGHKISHSNRKSKRTFKVNLQPVRVWDGTRRKRILVSTRAIRSGLIEKAAKTR
ncbi:50S ribosomal protein L28 [Pasteuria penetrans]|uniref:50S ribosomal protein L28 n=1 Tax=Pasteuria penetrans TaxID=86005 RepID=UPI000FAD1B18|nr:50S ribosomal protein L28 [Pasteuria penetrans]